MPGNVHKPGDFTRYEELIPIFVKIVLSNCVGKKLQVPIEIKLSHSFLVYEECLFVHFQMLT